MVADGTRQHVTHHLHYSALDLTEAGVTKGEVYWALGRIHIELGQSPKAKSMFQRGLEIEPGNQKLRNALTSLQ